MALMGDRPPRNDSVDGTPLPSRASLKATNPKKEGETGRQYKGRIQRMLWGQRKPPPGKKKGPGQSGQARREIKVQ